MAIERGNRLEIRTAEGVSFSLHLAGPVTRFLAWAIDACVIAVGGTLILSAANTLRPLNSDVMLGLSMVCYFVLSVGYAMLLEWYWRGQTLGKRLLRMRVADVQGLRLQFSQVALRNLLRAVDFLPYFYFVGGTAMLLNRRNQRLGDLAANTVVVRAPRALAPDFQQVLSGKYNSFRDHPHIEARLRQRVSAEEAALLVRALLRRGQLEPAGRIVLYQELAAHFRALAPFPEEAVLGLTDEQYLRNLVDSIFRETSGEKSAGEPSS